MIRKSHLGYIALVNGGVTLSLTLCDLWTVRSSSNSLGQNAGLGISVRGSSDPRVKTWVSLHTKQIPSSEPPGRDQRAGGRKSRSGSGSIVWQWLPWLWVGGSSSGEWGEHRGQDSSSSAAKVSPPG